MKRSITMFTILFLTFSLFAQVEKSNEVSLLKNSGDKLNKILDNHLYSQLTVEEWQNDAWVVVEKVYNDFDNSGIVEIHYEYYMDGSIFQAIKLTFSYSNGQIVQSITTIDENGDGSFVNDSKSELSYNGELQTESIQYDWENDDWVKVARSVNSHSSNLMIETIVYLWDGSDWVNYTKTMFEYDGENETLSLVQQWDGSNWNDISKTETEYTGGNKTQQQMFSWSGSDWTVTSTETWTYNDNDQVLVHEREATFAGFTTKNRITNTYEGGMLVEKLEENIPIGLTTWVPESKTLYTYSNGQVSEELVQTWTGAEFQNSRKLTYDYSAVSVDEPNLVVDQFKVYQNYPNPFNPSTSIRFDIAESGFYNLSVYNALGEKVAELINGEQTTGRHQVEFTADNLSSGIYFYILKGEGIKQSKKMILMK